MNVISKLTLDELRAISEEVIRTIADRRGLKEYLLQDENYYIALCPRDIRFFIQEAIIKLANDNKT